MKRIVNYFRFLYENKEMIIAPVLMVTGFYIVFIFSCMVADMLGG